MMVQAPGGTFSRLDVAVEQDGKTHPVFALNSDSAASGSRRDAADRLLVMRPIGKRAIPDLNSGSARIVVHAARPVLYGLRTVESTATAMCKCGSSRRGRCALHVRPINHGGSGSPYSGNARGRTIGVRVGDRKPPAFRRRAGIAGDPALRVAFALRATSPPAKIPGSA
jgi:hypothetical protein